MPLREGPDHVALIDLPDLFQCPLANRDSTDRNSGWPIVTATTSCQIAARDHSLPGGT